MLLDRTLCVKPVNLLSWDKELSIRTLHLLIQEEKPREALNKLSVNQLGPNQYISRYSLPINLSLSLQISLERKGGILFSNSKYNLGQLRNCNH